MTDVEGVVKNVDAWWTVLIIDRVATPLAYALARTEWITPNMVTLLSLVSAALASLFIAMASPLGLAAGGIMYQVAFVLDCVDGKLARIKGLSSPLGEYLDNFVDRVSTLLVTVALIYASWKVTRDTSLALFIAAYGILDTMAPCIGIAYSKLVETRCGGFAPRTGIRMSRVLLGEPGNGLRGLLVKYIDTLRRHRLNPYPSEIETNLLVYTVLPIYMSASLYKYGSVASSHVLAIIYVGLFTLAAIVILRLAIHYKMLSRCNAAETP